MPSSRSGRKHAADPVAAVNRIPFSEPDHPFALQVMYSENTPFPLPEDSPFAGNRWGYVNMGNGLRKRPRFEDGLTFTDDELDYRGLPELHGRLRADGCRARRDRGGHGGPAPGRRGARHVRRRAAAACRTARACTTWARCAWARPTTAPRSPTRTRGCGGSTASSSAATALIPTANAMNPTLMSVAIAVRGARKAIEELSAR